MSVTLPGSSVRLQLTFRSANLTTVDNFMPLIGIPSILPSDTDGPRYYFAIVTDKPK